MKVSTLALDVCAFKCAFGSKLKTSLFYYSAYFCYYLWVTVLFGTIYESHCTISVNVYLYLQYFQQKNFQF